MVHRAMKGRLVGIRLMWATEQGTSSKTGPQPLRVRSVEDPRRRSPSQITGSRPSIGGRGHVVVHYTALAASDSAMP